jgi:hypothetical protein
MYNRDITMSASKKETNGKQYTHHILDKLEEHDLYLKPKKCEFGREEIEYLGVIIG